MAATLRLMRVRTTRKKLWLMSRRVSLLRQPGTTMRSRRSSERKKSRLSSTRFFLSASSASPAADVVVPTLSARLAASRADAAFCSAMEWRTRWIRATNSVM